MTIFNVGLCCVMLRVIYVMFEYLFNFDSKVVETVFEVIFLIGLILFGIVIVYIIFTSPSVTSMLFGVIYLLSVSIVMKDDYKDYIKKENK